MTSEQRKSRWLRAFGRASEWATKARDLMQDPSLHGLEVPIEVQNEALALEQAFQGLANLARQARERARDREPRVLCTKRGRACSREAGHLGACVV